MTASSVKQLQNFFSTFSPNAKPLLLLDYDGTLAPFRIDRFRARPWAGVRDLIHQIQIETSTRIAIITGRPPAEIAPLLGLALEVWGLHGAERLYPDGRRDMEKIPSAARIALRKLTAQLQSDSFGALLELKNNAVVVHWRGASPEKSRAIAKKARALFAPYAGIASLNLLHFEAGLELRAGRDKGGAVRAILKEAGAASRPIAFLGDDLTDEAAFLAVKGRGLSVLVRTGKRKTAADLWLRPPTELRAFLESWLQACRSSHTNKSQR